jgi:hypothetical protein
VDLDESQVPHPPSEEDSEGHGDYCRAIEAYLCRKNDGHLIRIVGPSFEKVCSWAEKGVPLTVVYRGIDRHFERYYSKGPRRRPVRIDFCEADVLDVFDEWRRALGVPAAGPQAEPRDRHESLPSHLERVLARLMSLRSADESELDRLIESIVRELDSARGTAKGVRGAARAALLARLADLDAQLIAAARERLTAEVRAELRREAEAELAPFRTRMAQAAYEQSLAVCMDRLLRERGRLPILTLE